MKNRIVISSKASQYGLVALTVAAAAFLTVALINDGLRELIRILPLSSAVILFTGWMWVWPRVELTETGVTVHNQFRTIRIPWSQLTKAEARFGLFLICENNREFYAAGVPSRARHSASDTNSELFLPKRQTDKGVPVRISLSPGQASALINYEIGHHQDPDLTPVADGEPGAAVKIVCNWAFPVATIALLVLSTMAIVSH